MCDCKNIELGSYDNQQTLYTWWNNTPVGIDKCLLSEIKRLWSNKIKTTGCCCGHNKTIPVIAVTKHDHEKMISLGYKYWVNDFGAMCYQPKTTL